MFILNQISGIGDFSIADNLRLIIIVVIFIGIIVVLLYLKTAKKGRKTQKKYMHAANSHDSSSKEKRPFVDVEEDFLGIEEDTEAAPAVSLDKTVTDIEDRERKNVIRQEADIEDVKAEFATIVAGLISKIEDRDTEILTKVENVVNTKVQEVLSKINDRIDEVLQAQEKSTALVLEKKIGSLRQKEEPVSNKIQETIEDKHATSETPVDTLSSQESKVVADKKMGFEETPGETADFDMEEFLKEEPIGLSFSGESKTVVEEEVVPEEIKEEELEVLSEGKEDIKTEKEEPIASTGEVEEKGSGKDEKDEGESADFDIQKFLDELENLPSENDPETEK